MTARFVTGALLALALTLWPPGTQAEDALVENGGITAVQRAQIDALACHAWHQRHIDTFRTEGSEGRGVLRVSLECEPHGEYRGLLVRQVGVCEDSGGWKCRQTGLEINVTLAAEQRDVRLVDVSPEVGLPLLEFLDSEARRGKRIRPGLFDGAMTLMGPGDDGHYVALFEFADHGNSLEIEAKCNKRGCRYRLGEGRSWPNY